MSDIKRFTERELDRIIEMAWEDRTPFEAIVSIWTTGKRSYQSHARQP